MKEENFSTLLQETMGNEPLEGRVMQGTVIGLERDFALIDVGLKADGRIPLREFSINEEAVSIGDKVDVYIERLENRDGEAILSREKARREASWKRLEEFFHKKENVIGMISGRVKGGFTVDLSGVTAFLPGSQVDNKPIRDISPLIGQKQPFQILKMDKKRGNLVVSRRAILDESNINDRSAIEKLSVGDIVEGTVKNLTEFGAFIDLGGIDSLLHIVDMSWKRLKHPSELLTVGQKIRVKVINFDEKNCRIGLGLKQLQKDPWEDVDSRYKVGQKINGVITTIKGYGAFVELECGLEGLIHTSEMNWTKKTVNPSHIVSTSQEVEVCVLRVDKKERHIALGLKQCLPNPWEILQSQYHVGDIIEGVIKDITSFGLFIGILEDIDGMVHISDCAWEKPEEAFSTYKIGDKIKVKILDINQEEGKLSLGIKQMFDDPFTTALSGIKIGDIVTCTVIGAIENGLSVMVHDSINGVIRRSELSIDRTDQRLNRFARGEKVDAKVTAIDSTHRRVYLSIKAREIEEEKAAMKAYGSTNSGAVLGDILSKALKNKNKQ